MNKNLDLEYKHEWLQKMADVCEASSTIDSTLFDKYEVAPGYMGACQFCIPQERIQNIIKKEYFVK